MIAYDGTTRIDTPTNIPINAFFTLIFSSLY